MKNDSKLETALINLFRNGGNMNISQTTAQLHTDAAMRLYNTPKVKAVMLKLEKDGLLKRETTDGITRFRWNTPRYTVEPGRAIFRDGKPLVTIERFVDSNAKAELSPWEADELVHKIVTMLNTEGK